VRLADGGERVGNLRDAVLHPGIRLHGFDREIMPVTLPSSLTTGRTPQS
jgi:hypothetical protein